MAGASGTFPICGEGLGELKEDSVELGNNGWKQEGVQDQEGLRKKVSPVNKEKVLREKMLFSGKAI